MLWMRNEFAALLIKLQSIEIRVRSSLSVEARLNNIFEFSPYLNENTTLHHYNDQLVHAV
jgi:hypothetical protein